MRNHPLGHRAVSRGGAGHVYHFARAALRGAALALHADRSHEVLVGRRAAPLEETAGQGTIDAAQVEAVATGIADVAQVDALFAAMQSRFGRLDLVFNNASARRPRVPMRDRDIAGWKRCIGMNLTGAFGRK